MPPTTVLRTAEYLVVDTETNGRPGADCEVTEIGAVLVGGGELHERWETLLAVRAPLGRGIQRFTGISQAMVDEAPAAEAMLPDLAALLEGRVLVAHSAQFDVRVLRQAFAREGVRWPDPPVLCTVALARRLAPLARQRRLGPLAEHLGIEVGVTHRALADAETCARVLCALLPRLCAHATTLEDACALLTPARPRRARAGATDGGRSLHGVRRRALDTSHLPREPGVYVFRNGAGQPLYVGKSVDVCARARAHFAPSSPDSDWVAQAEVVEYETTASELGALLLEHRRVGELKPPGNARLKHVDAHVWLRCRLDIALPILEVAAEPSAGRAVNIGPLRGRHAALELVEQLNSLFGLRHCGRALPRREWPSAYGQMGRCLSPCLRDLDPNAYRGRLDQALALVGGGDAGRPLLAHVERQMHAAAAAQAYERATWLRRRGARLRELLERLGTAVEATHVRPRLILAEHPDGERADAVFLVGGRVVDWGEARGVDDLVARTQRALARAPRPTEVPSLTAEKPRRRASPRAGWRARSRASSRCAPRRTPRAWRGSTRACWGSGWSAPFVLGLARRSQGRTELPSRPRGGQCPERSPAGEAPRSRRRERSARLR
jgi:DNA polymerase-3 subunit epsilon